LPEKIAMSHSTGKIATVTGADSAATQALFAALADGWRASGLKVVGVIAEAHGLPDRTCSAGILRDIVSGNPYPIYLETAPANTSCHLDAAGVETACTTLLDQIAASDVVVLSKFGKLEAMRQGLAGAFEAAIAAGKPVLTTVSEKHRDAWRAFAPDTVWLAADKAAIDAWQRAARAAG
jgi:nucleoside-triphosphatase THEP1